MAVIDMRPAKGTILYEMLRLGLTFDSKTLDGHNTWVNYQTQLRAEFDTDAEGALIEGIRLTDMVTRVQKIISLDELRTTSSIVTWTSKNPLTQNNGDITDSSIDLND